MKFKSSIEINAPRDLVVKYFADPQYLGEYQDGFVRKDHVSGEPGQEGAVSKMYYDDGKRKMELTETITANDLPDSFAGFYHHKHMDNTMQCTFTALDENRTRYDSAFEYTRMSWVMPKLMSLLFPGMFKKMGEKWMNNFKEFVEREAQSQQV